MFKKLSNLLGAKFSHRDELGKQIEIVKIFDLYKTQAGRLLPPQTTIRPLRIRNKTLLVHASSSVMANELRLRESEILQTINSAFGREVVAKIRYRF